MTDKQLQAFVEWREAMEIPFGQFLQQRNGELKEADIALQEAFRAGVLAAETPKPVAAPTERWEQCEACRNESMGA